MMLLFIGPQGSGKGTQAKIISEKLGIPHISSGDLLRNVKGVFKKQVDAFINKGQLISDELMLKILNRRISQPDCKNGFILDGFPRNMKQAEAIDKIIAIDSVVEISISDEEAIKRISKRLSCKKCGSVYNTETLPPKQDNICDKCSSTLYKRLDDNEEAIKKRLATYHAETEPLLKHYSAIKINGEQEIEKVTQDIMKAINQPINGLLTQ